MLRRWFRSAGLRCVVLALVVLGLAGRLEAQIPPFVYAYDEAGRLVGVADAAGNTATYTYDALGNILSIVRGSAAVSILEFSPNAGPAGTSVTITGAGFGAGVGDNAVTFNGVSATVVSAAPNRLVAVVPAGATSGPIGVTSPSGSAVSTDSFVVGPGSAPTISGFTPTVGTVGSAVTITGTNFETAAGGNKVGFNGYLGAVSSATPTAIGAMIPSTATSGHITVSTPNGRAISTGDFFVPPSPYTAADVEVTGRMAIGETRAVPISVANKIGMILFDGAVGQRLSLSASLGPGLSGGSCDAMSIRRPDGAVLSSASASACNSLGFIDLQVLPVAGTYLITFDPAGTSTGTATLTLHDVPADASAPIVPGGAPVTVTTTVPGQNVQVSFSGTAGQRVSLKVGFPATCNDVSIQNPDGTALLSPTLTCATTYFTDVRVLPATGTYVITVNPRDLIVGNVTLTLYNVPSDATASLVAGGSPVTVTTTVPGQNVQASFSGTAGQRVSLKVGFVSTCNDVSIQNPDGTALLSSTLTCSTTYFTDVIVLPATGTYAITVNPRDLAIGNVTLTLYGVPADATATATVNGSAAPLTTTVPGQNAMVSFSGSASQAVTVRITGNTMGSITVTLRKPDGTTQTSSSSSAASFNLPAQTLAAAGTYTILVNPSGTNIGSINVAITSP
jgi:YD repeat-containing protein